MTLRQYQLFALVLATLGGGVFYLSTNGDGSWRVVGICLGLAYLVGLVVLSRRLQKRVRAGGPLPQAVANVRWFTADEGGRPAPPPGPEYRATAVFAQTREEAPLGVYFSVILTFPEGQMSTVEARAAGVRFLDVAMVRPRLAPGATFFVMEPPRAVAEAVVEKVYPNN